MWKSPKKAEEEWNERGRELAMLHKIKILWSKEEKISQMLPGPHLQPLNGKPRKMHSSAGWTRDCYRSMDPHQFHLQICLHRTLIRLRDHPDLRDDRGRQASRRKRQHE